MQKTYYFTLFSTAIGPCGIAWSESGIVAVQLPESDQLQTCKSLCAKLKGQMTKTNPPLELKAVIKAIKAHLAGQVQNFADFKLDLRDLPPFHRAVYLAARKVPSGTTVSYGELARAAGAPGAARAVGQAMSRNPLAILIPCHRIIAGNGKLGGFTAYGGCNLKEKLLDMEQIKDLDPAENKRAKTSRAK